MEQDYCTTCQAPRTIVDDFDDQEGFEEKATPVRVIRLVRSHSRTEEQVMMCQLHPTSRLVWVNKLNRLACLICLVHKRGEFAYLRQVRA